MKIRLLNDIPVAIENNLHKGRELETIPCPEKYKHLENKKGVWVRGDVDEVRIFSHEYEIIEK